MKKTAALFICIFMVCIYTTGCKVGGGGCKDCVHYATLQGTIMNAITGERIGGKDMEIYLIQGDTVRKPTTFNTGEKNGGGFFQRNDNATTALMGEYSFTDIPAGSSFATGDATNPTDPEHNEYKMVVIKAGYQRFEAVVDLFDIDNKIGNIYLFPEGYATPDYIFNIVCKDGGKPVPNATVLFQPQAAANDMLTSDDNVLKPANGYLPSLQAVSDAKGMVTFAGSKLALGARYALTVLPVEFEGIHLGINEDSTFDIGYTTSYYIDMVYLVDLEGYDYGLYVKEISNLAYDQVDSTGTLKITFNRPVTLGARPAPATANFGATASVAGYHASSGVLDATAPVTAVPSTDGLTLTLTPKWTTAPAATDFDTAIQYLDGTGYLSVKGYPGSVINLTNLQDAYGNYISTTVLLTTP